MVSESAALYSMLRIVGVWQGSITNSTELVYTAPPPSVRFGIELGAEAKVSGEFSCDSKVNLLATFLSAY